MEQVKNESGYYSAAIYCRLSKDDEQSGESVSIETQKMLLQDYCAEHGYAIYEIYADDGFSGLNFNRPAFTRMLEDIDGGKVNLVITTVNMLSLKRFSTNCSNPRRQHITLRLRIFIHIMSAMRKCWCIIVVTIGVLRGENKKLIIGNLIKIVYLIYMNYLMKILHEWLKAELQ